MRIGKPIAGLVVVMTVLAWKGDEASGLPFGPPRPPGPPGGMRPPGPVMGPSGGPVRPGAIGPGGIGGPVRPRVGMPGGAFGGIGGPVGPGPGGIGGPGRPGPGGIGGPGRLPAGIGGPVRPDGRGMPADLRGLGGLGSLARSGAGAGRNSTAPVNREALANQANRVRDHFNGHDHFNRDWGRRHAGAWWAAGWATAAAAYGSPTWADCSGYCGYAAEPAYYDYGSNAVYEGGNVYVNGDAVATQEQYAQQATDIADTGKQARATEDEEWLPLGVFAMVQGEQVNGNDLFQLAVNRSGVIRGNYYHTLSDTTLPVYGSVDRNTQRAAWTVGDRKEPVFEAGFANLTRSETTLLVHFGKERTQQWTLLRIHQ